MNKQRLTVSLIAWATSILAISFSAIAVWKERSIPALVTFGFPWLALLVMTVGWVGNKRLSRFWPLSGTAVALYAVFHTAGAALVFAPLAILLAVALVMYHLRLDAENRSQ